MKRHRADARKFHFIYRTTCNVTQRYYIGMHSTDDMDDGYLGSGRLLNLSLKKHGAQTHVREILEDCSARGRAFLREREKIWINETILKDHLCMNRALGGEGGPIRFGKHSAETCKKISEARKGMKFSSETRKKMSEIALSRYAGSFFEKLIERKQDPVYRKKLSESIKKSWDRSSIDDIKARGAKISSAVKAAYDNNSLKTVEARAKISEASKRRWALMTAEQRKEYCSKIALSRWKRKDG